MVKELYDQFMNRHMLKNKNTAKVIQPSTDDNKVIVAAEAWYPFHVGDRIKLTKKMNEFGFVSEDGEYIPSMICTNIPVQEAECLATVNAEFSVTAVKNSTFKAEIVSPYSLVHHGQREWLYLN